MVGEQWGSKTCLGYALSVGCWFVKVPNIHHGPTKKNNNASETRMTGKK